MAFGTIRRLVGLHFGSTGGVTAGIRSYATHAARRAELTLSERCKPIGRRQVAASEADAREEIGAVG